MTEERPDDTAPQPQGQTQPHAPVWGGPPAQGDGHQQPSPHSTPAQAAPPQQSVHQPTSHQLPGQQPASGVYAQQGYGGQFPPPAAPHNAPHGAPQQPYGAPNQAYGPAGGSTAPPKRSNRAAVPLAALLAAVLASGGTYALTQGNNSAEPTAAGNTTVVEGDPADYAEAGSINWSATSSKVTPSVVAITAGSSGGSGGSGSGVVLDEDGHIVTNHHVVAGSDRLEVTLSDKRSYNAKIVGTDPSTDLAVIQIENPPSGLKPVSLGKDDKLTVGQPVMAVGNPLGLAGTVTTGIVSALNRPVSTQQKPTEPGQPGAAPESGAEVVTNAIQTSAAINPGNSGGALVDGSGDLIGINSSIATLSGSPGSSQGGNIGIGFAIPVTVVKNITEQLIADGSADHAQLGVTATNGTAKVDGASVGGAKVVSVADDSGAARAGLKKNDVILKIDGESVDSSTSLVGQVRERTVNQRVVLSIVRDGERQDVTVTLGQAPSE